MLILTLLLKNTAFNIIQLKNRLGVIYPNYLRTPDFNIMNLSRIRFKRLSNSTAIGKTFRFAFCRIHAVKVRRPQVVWVYVLVRTKKASNLIVCIKTAINCFATFLDKCQPIVTI